MLSRRHVLGGMAALPLVLGSKGSFAGVPLKKLKMPPLLDATESGRFLLEAQHGTSDFVSSGTSDTWGFNQAFLGPTVRLSTGQTTRAQIRNSLPEAISVHWHGMLIPGEADGGPHQTVAPGKTWLPELAVTQPAATLWYHSHVHLETGRQVQKGLAGVLQVVDGQDDERGLPHDYGVDDFTLVLQDRRFGRNGQIDYSLSMPDQMMGFLGDTMVVNGQVGAKAAVPRGIVRLRLLNGSNSRIYPLSLSDGREMHLIATDSGYLDKPIPLASLWIAPGERYEILVDFSAGGDCALVSDGNPNQMMGGMMGGRGGGSFVVIPFRTDGSLKPRFKSLPGDLGGNMPKGEPSQAGKRKVTLDMPMGMGMMMGMFSGGSSRRFSINGKSFDMNRIDFTAKLGSVERWEVSANMMMHPFHVHGVRFQVLSENGRRPAAQNTGWKDTVLVNGSAELLIHFTQPAPKHAPFMHHCHILEHEDGGMMGQFTVT